MGMGENRWNIWRPFGKRGRGHRAPPKPRLEAKTGECAGGLGLQTGRRISREKTKTGREAEDEPGFQPGQLSSPSLCKALLLGQIPGELCNHHLAASYLPFPSTYKQQLYTPTPSTLLRAHSSKFQIFFAL